MKQGKIPDACLELELKLKELEDKIKKLKEKLRFKAECPKGTVKIDSDLET